MSLRTESPTGIRTEQRPMAFSRREFWRGVRAAWGSAMILLTGALVYAGVVSSGPPWGPPHSMIIISLMYGLPLGALALTVASLAGAPLAWLIGTSLARVRGVWVHLTAFAVYGAVWAVTLTAAYLAFFGTPISTALSSPYLAVIAVGSALVVAAGWGWTVRQSRREAEFAPR